jgi:hypothetical protein
VRFDSDEIEAAYYGLAGFIRLCELDPRRSTPPPTEVSRLYHKLDAVVRMSPTRHETGCGADDAEPSELWIGSPEASRILGWSKRQVQRHAHEMGGRIIGGRWLCRESDVIAFAAERLATDAT